jgi:hypothetical protein
VFLRSLLITLANRRPRRRISEDANLLIELVLVVALDLPAAKKSTTKDDHDDENVKTQIS